jgi:2-octaprenyl-6-methoxyphenol hydroxylase
MEKNICECDILVIGGGPVGGVLAGLLANYPFRIIVVDHLSPEQVLKKERDGRTTAISWGSSRIIEKTGLWQSIVPHTTAIQEIRVSQASTSGYIHFSREDAGGNPMGFILENRIFREKIYQMIEERDNISLIHPTFVKSLTIHPYKVEAVLSNKQVIHARLIVGADGRLSHTREQVGIRSFTSAYHQTAIVTSVSHQYPHHNVAFEHFLPTGPLAFLPLHTHQSSVVWSLKDKWLEVMKSLNSRDFVQELEHRFPYLGSLKLESERWYHPLFLTLPRRIKGERCVLIGDAAHTIHPIAGQGANLGFRDAEILSTFLYESAKLGLDIGSDDILSRYQRKRARDILLMTGVTDSLVRFFSNKSSVLAFARKPGMSLVHKISPLRRLLTRYAMGVDT